jgi:hypothetical protein
MYFYWNTNPELNRQQQTYHTDRPDVFIKNTGKSCAGMLTPVDFSTIGKVYTNL